MLSVCLSTVAYAGDIVPPEDAPELTEAEVQETLKANEELFQKNHNGMSSEEFFKKIDEEKASESEASAEKKPELELIHQVEKKVYALPECGDTKLYEKTKEFIDSYFEKLNSKGTLYRRRHYFVVKGLEQFIKEDIVAYKTTNKSVVANAIANIEMNYGLDDDNLRLCKSTSQNKYVKNVYLLIFPKDDGYIVQILNLMDRQKEDNSDISFFYKN